MGIFGFVYFEIVVKPSFLQTKNKKIPPALSLYKKTVGKLSGYFPVCFISKTIFKDEAFVKN